METYVTAYEHSCDASRLQCAIRVALNSARARLGFHGDPRSQLHCDWARRLGPFHFLGQAMRAELKLRRWHNIAPGFFLIADQTPAGRRRFIAAACAACEARALPAGVVRRILRLVTLLGCFVPKDARDTRDKTRPRPGAHALCFSTAWQFFQYIDRAQNLCSGPLFEGVHYECTIDAAQFE